MQSNRTFFLKSVARDRLWLTPKKISEWAFQQCVDGEDTPEMREMITDSHWAYLYCKNVALREEVAVNVQDPTWSGLLCKMLEELPELLKDKSWKNVYQKLLVYARWSPRYMTDSSCSSKYGRS